MGFWAWFWIAAIVCVAALIIVSRVDGAKGWAERVLGRVLPALALPVGFLAQLQKRAWMLLAIPLAIGIWIGVTETWKQQGRLEERIKDERVNTELAQHETNVANRGAALADRTRAEEDRVREVIADAEQELDHAAQAVDPDALWIAYDRAYRRVWNDSTPSGEPDTPASRPDRVRGADPYTA